MCSKAALSLLFPAGQVRENIKKGSWSEISTGGNHSPIMDLTSLGEMTLIYYQTKQSRITRNTIQILQHFSSTPHFFLVSTPLPNSLPSPHQRYWGTGNGGSSQFIVCCPSFSFLLGNRTPHTLLLLQCGVPPMADSPL